MRVAGAFLRYFLVTFPVVQSFVVHSPTRMDCFPTIKRSLLAATSPEFALLFDCDGVILETEEFHRLAYNEAFRKFDLSIGGKPVEWSVSFEFDVLFSAHTPLLLFSKVEYYDVLQNTVGGGKPKMFFHFRNTTQQFPSVAGNPPPSTEEEQQDLIDQLQAFKTDYFKILVESEAKPRPGVVELMDEALADPSVAVGVCSAATKVCLSNGVHAPRFSSCYVLVYLL